MSITRHVYTRDKITRADHILGNVIDMIDGLKQAQDNRGQLVVLEEGTGSIHDSTRDVTPDKLQSGVQEHHYAVVYVDNTASLVAPEASEMSNVDFEAYRENVDADLAQEDVPDVPRAGDSITSSVTDAILYVLRMATQMEMMTIWLQTTTPHHLSHSACTPKKTRPCRAKEH